MISFNNRFHGHSSLNYVYKNGQSFRSRLFVLKIVENKKRKKSRVAVVISKKVLKSAVRRNRVRRRVYEYIRLRLPEINNKYDIVIMVLNGEAYGVSYNELTSQLNQLFKQANL